MFSIEFEKMIFFLITKEKNKIKASPVSFRNLEHAAGTLRPRGTLENRVRETFDKKSRWFARESRPWFPTSWAGKGSINWA